MATCIFPLADGAIKMMLAMATLATGMAANEGATGRIFTLNLMGNVLRIDVNGRPVQYSAG